MSKDKKIKLENELATAQARIKLLEDNIRNAQVTIWAMMGCPERVALPAPGECVGDILDELREGIDATRPTSRLWEVTA